MAQQGGRLPAKYRRIAEDLRARIERGEWPADARLPALPELAAQYRSAQGTVDKALEVLRQAGMAETIHGTGTFVRKPAAARAGPADGYSRLSAEVAGLAEALGRVEGNLVELYGKTGNDYPWEDLPDSAQPAAGKDGIHEQRA
jgi:GntR family transcriptional regulator